MKGNVAEAMKFLMGTIQFDPTNAKAYQYLSEAYRQAGIYDIALDTCDRGLAIAPGNKALEELSWRIEQNMRGEHHAISCTLYTPHHRSVYRLKTALRYPECGP
jgi:tetratricopeptide (TPR) repeat protein